MDNKIVETRINCINPIRVMVTGEAKRETFSKDKEEFPLYFGEWVKRRRQALDLTQCQLAKRASCSVFAIRKIEMGERRPSRQLAELLAISLEIPAEDQPPFIRAARGELSIDRLPSPGQLISREFQPADRSGVIPGDLPRELTPFIGRDPELNTLGQLLKDAQCRLLTIVGQGGVGKTRLAIEAAHQTQQLFPDGVWFVPLVSLNSPVQIVPAIAGALDFKFQEAANPQAQLLRYLGTQRVLLVLDNAEHLLEGVGVFVEILRDCQEVKLLVTSRERLNLLSEWAFEIQGLPVPPKEQEEQFEMYSSVALFLQSARRARAGYEIGEDERQWVLRICEIMEGLPLGIELSAAWVGLLSCEEIAREIENNLDFLSVSMRDLPERHRSLRATLEYSWRLLSEEEKKILSRMSVFRGSFRREAAQEICGANLAILSSLKNKTLLYRSDQDYYSLHEMVRQYAALKLVEDPGENERVKDLHALYYVQRLAEWEKALQGSQQLEIFNEMAKVIGNLSQGWQRMVTQCRPKAGKSKQFCADLLHSALFSISLFYEMRCRSLEAIALLEESVKYLKTVKGEYEKTEECSQFISVLGHITAYLGLHHIYILQYDKSREYLEKAIQLLDSSQSIVESTQAQVMLAMAYPAQGHLLNSTVMLEQSREIFREEGQNWWYLLSTINLASHYASLGKLQESEALFQEGFRLVEPGDFRLGLPLRTDFAYVLNLQGDFDKAEQLMRDNLQLSYQFGNYRLTAQIYLDLGRVALATQRIALAEEYIQKSINLLIEYGESRDLAMHRIYLGKCFITRSDLNAARDQFCQVIKIGQELDKVHLVYWGLANIARTYIAGGQTEKALEISLALRHCPIEFTRIQDEGVRLLADLQAALSKEQIESAMKKVDSEISPDKVVVGALSYALERV